MFRLKISARFPFLSVSPANRHTRRSANGNGLVDGVKRDPTRPPVTLNTHPVNRHLFLEEALEQHHRAVVLRADLAAVLDRDPACNRYLEPLLFFKGFHALVTHRFAHELWRQGRTDFALYLQSQSSKIFTTDIHPAARFGRGIWLVQMFYNIILSKPFAEKNNLPTQMDASTPLVDDYMRKSIAEFVGPNRADMPFAELSHVRHADAKCTQSARIGMLQHAGENGNPPR